MKLISAKVSNYRIHGDQSIDFDPKLNLIGGENESGKSTLVEAIHRGLFLKGKVTGEVQKQMVSTTHSGNPEVEVTFETNGSRYTVMKKFSGQSGSIHLAEAGGQSWTGEDAESRLASLLQVEGLGGGRGIKERLHRQWGHLWVWQGKSGEDPASHATSQQVQLIKQLQQIGGAAALQSQKDARVGAQFADRYGQFFTSSGKLKKGSDPDAAESEAQVAREIEAEKSERVKRLYQAMQDERDASRLLGQSAGNEKEHLQQIDEIRAKQNQAKDLKQEIEHRKSELKAASNRFDGLAKIGETIAEFEKRINKINTNLSPKQAELDALEKKLGEASRRYDEASKAYEATTETTRLQRIRKDLTEKAIEKLEAEEKARALQAQQEQANAHQKEIDSLKEKIAKLPPISSDLLEKIQNQENALREGEAALAAMAASIEIIESKESILLGETPIRPGSPEIITEPSELVIGKATKIRIQPGGGDDLKQRRESAKALQDELKISLDSLGLASVKDASETLARIQFLTRKIETFQAKLETLDAKTLPRLVTESNQRIASLTADIERRDKLLTDFQAPTTLDKAKAKRIELETALSRLEEDEARLKRNRNAAKASLDTLSEQRSEHRNALEQEKRSLNEASAQLSLLIEQHGDQQTRDETFQSAKTELAKAQKRFQVSSQKLSDLQPDQIEADLNRLNRALSNARTQQTEAARKQAVAQDQLRSDGSENPAADLELAQSALEQAESRLSRAQKQAQAIKLLHELFKSEQLALSNRFNKPLADKITGYMKLIFGPEARAELSINDGSFQSISLVRSPEESALEFERLSGGAKEQLAAAVRLAIAEVLSADYGGSLPIVFDDAFAYSDPDRIRKLQGMLDLAASHGLQVIVLSCNPSDYSDLGAKTIELTQSSLS